MRFIGSNELVGKRIVGTLLLSSPGGDLLIFDDFTGAVYHAESPSGWRAYDKEELQDLLERKLTQAQEAQKEGGKQVARVLEAIEAAELSAALGEARE